MRQPLRTIVLAHCTRQKYGVVLWGKEYVKGKV